MEEVIKMVNEEYSFQELKPYLLESDNNTILICGFLTNEDRSSFFSKEWLKNEENILMLEQTENSNADIIKYIYYEKGKEKKKDKFKCNEEFLHFLKHMKVQESKVLLDLSSLSHVLIMYALKNLLLEVIPRLLFASYIRPTRYLNQSEDIGFSLSKSISGINSVPGFVKRARDQERLCAFVGFEGVRLKSLLENLTTIERFDTILAFPSDIAQWYNVTAWNVSDLMHSTVKDGVMRKCFSESIFDAVKILKDIGRNGERLVLAPLGTRAHSAACAIFASEYPNARIVYDYPVECDNRTEGIDRIIVYHLSSYLKTL